MSFHVPSFGSIYNFGHKCLIDFLDGPIQVTEKVDASFFSFCKQAGQYYSRSKGQQLITDNPEKLFVKVVNATKDLDLKDGWIYAGEAFNSTKHNTLGYSRMPRN